MLNMGQLMSVARSGGDPRQLIRQAAQNNPQAAMAMRMMEGKNATQLQQMAQNMARERGLSVQDIARQLGIW